MIHCRCPLALFAFAVFAAVPVAAQAAHSPPGSGVTIKPPKGWLWQPAADERGQVVLSFAAPRALAMRSRGSHLPVLRVARLADEEPAPADIDGLPGRVTGHDVTDYLQGVYGNGMFVAERTDGEIGGHPAVLFTARTARDENKIACYGALVRGPQRIMAEFEIDNDQLAKHQKVFDLAIASLRIEAPSDTAAPVAPWQADAGDWQAMDAAARRRARQAHAEACVEAAAKADEPGWKAHKSKFWTVRSAAGGGETKKAIKAAEAARAWCEKTFAGIGDGGPLPAVLRVFSSPDHYSVFKARLNEQREFSPERRELYFYEDPNAGTADGWGMMFRAVLWQWIDDAAPGSFAHLPRWLDSGLSEYLRSSKLKGRNIEFLSSEVESGRIDYQQRNETMPALWNLVQESMQPSPENGAVEERWGYTPECARLVRWVVDHDGSKAFGMESMLSRYIAGVAEAAAAVGPDPTLRIDTMALDAAQAKTRRERYYAWRDQLLVAINDRVVPLETDAWQAANAAWLQFNKDF